MKGYKILKNILQVIVLVVCFALQCNAELPPPFDRPLQMTEIFMRDLAGESKQEEERQNLYDGIRFARRQQCLEITDVKDISERKTRIDQCDGFRGSSACDERQAQNNVSSGTIGKLKYGRNTREWIESGSAVADAGEVISSVGSTVVAVGSTVVAVGSAAVAEGSAAVAEGSAHSSVTGGAISSVGSAAVAEGSAHSSVTGGAISSVGSAAVAVGSAVADAGEVISSVGSTVVAEGRKIFSIFSKGASLPQCLEPGVVNDRMHLYNFYKEFRETKDDPKSFQEKTKNFAKPNSNGGIHFVQTDSDGDFINNYNESAQTIYSSSYDNNYKKCNVGNLGHATRSNDSRVEDYTADDASFFIPMLQSEDFFDDLSNQSCEFILDHMKTYIYTTLAAEISSATGATSCAIANTMVANTMGLKDGIKKAKKTKEIEGIIQYMKQAMLDKASSTAKSAKQKLAKMGSNVLMHGAYYCYEGATNVLHGSYDVNRCTLLYSGSVYALGKCIASSSACIASGIASGTSCLVILGGLIPYYSQLAERFSKANQTFQTNQMCGSEWLTWNFDKKTQQWQKDKTKSYEACLDNLFLNKSEFEKNKEECKKYGKFTNGKLIDSNKRKFDFNGADFTESTKPDLNNQYYREFWFRGIEYEDNDGSCKNPWDPARRRRYLGYDTEKQRYYTRGPVSEAGGNKISIDYACHRFLRNVPGAAKEENNSYQCCKRKAQNSICIEEKLVYREDDDDYKSHKYKFCSLGDNSCQIDDLNDTKYAIFSSKNNPEYICAKTASHCPYDHYLSGGTEKKFESFVATKQNGDEPIKTVTANFCQHLAHCAKTENTFTRIPLPNNSYLSLACRNFIGDSLFKSPLLSGGKNSIDLSQSDVIVQKKSRNLTAPMVQCLKETLENYLLRKKAVICTDDQDYQTEEYKQYNICRSNPVVIASPGQVANQSVFFELRQKFQISIRWALTLSVAIFGLLMLFAGNKVSEMLNKKTLAVFVFKIGIVSYFALGNAWESFFMKTVFEAPLQFAELAFQTNARQSENNVYQVKTITPPRLSKSSDGCIFPPVDENGNPIIIVNSSKKSITQMISPGIFKIEDSSEYFKIENGVLKKSNEADGIYIQDLNYNVLSYPANKEYLRIFDTFDCKITHLLGYSSKVSVPNFLQMILVGFFSGGLGFAFMLASMLFAFFIILIALRVVHLIIVTIIVLSILVYISPLAFCCLMFKKTQHIFNQWLSQIMGYIVQPVIIFAYLGLFLTVIDNTIIGNAQFNNINSAYDGHFQTLNCEERTDIFGKKIMTNSLLCDMETAKLIESPKEDSDALFTKNHLRPFNIDIKSFPYDPGKKEGRERLKTIFQLALITFIFYKIFEYITSLAASLTGAENSTNMLNALTQNIKGLAKKGASVVAGAEKIGRDMQVRGSKDFLSRGAQKGKEDASKKDDKNTGGTASSKTTGGGDGGGAA